jgi:DNA-directed RNA polymerase beta subunit
MPTSTVRKKFPVTTLLRAIGFDTDKAILDIFDLADEVKATEDSLEKSIGRKLAARVLRSWTEDFVDEDTGEVVPSSGTKSSWNAMSCSMKKISSSSSKQEQIT